MKTYYQMISDLRGYEPKDRHFTSNEEIQMLNEHFGLDKMSVLELQNLRDMFMLYYLSPGNQNENGAWFSTNAMMSVTAVIDHYKIQKGGEI